jgi:hypothetical protein
MATPVLTRSDSSDGSSATGAVWSLRRRLVALAADVAPGVFAVPVLAGVIASIRSLLSVADPDLRWATTVNSDAEALYLGVSIYQDPADGYTGQLYTPFFPFVVSLLYRLHFWTGWPLLVVELSGLGLVAMVAWVSRRPGRPWSLIGGVGIGALCWWAVSSLDNSMLYEARGDQFAWLLALGGLITASAATRTTRYWPLVVAVLLLCAAFWTKQNTVAAPVVVVLWFAVLAACGAITVRRVVLLVSMLVVGNLLVFGALNLITDGWEWRLNFVLPSHHWQSPDIMVWINEGLRGGALTFAFLGAMGLVALARVPRHRVRLARVRPAVAAWHAQARPAVTAAAPLALMVLVGFVLAVYFRRKQGGSDNHFLGAIWAAGLLGGLLWSVAGASLRRSVAASLVVLAFLVVGWRTASDPLPGNHGVVVRPLHMVADVGPHSPVLLRLADSGLVYMTMFGDLNVRKQRVIYPNYYNYVDLLAAGSQPLALVRAFEDRRFAFLEPVPETPENAEYTSAHGKWEENWLWKVNQVIAARYLPSRRVVPLFEPRPGPERAVWQRACFGPFTLAGTDWRIGHGGGFWCNPASGLVTQRGTPAPTTELRTDGAVDGLRGLLRLKLAVGYRLRIEQGDANKPRVVVLVERPSVTRYRVSVKAAAAPAAIASVPLGRDGLLRLTLAHGAPDVAIDDSAVGSVTAALPMAKDIVRLDTDSGSDLRLDLRGARTGG